MILLSRIFLLLLIIVLLVFSVSNLDAVTVKFLTWESMKIPLFLVILFVFFFGVILALLWQALHGLTSPKKTKPKVSPTVTKPPEEKKVKRGWGFKNKTKSDQTETTDNADMEPIRTETYSVAAEGPEADSATDSDKKVS